MATRLTRVPSLKEHLDESLTAQRNENLSFLSRIVSHGKGILQPHELMSEFGVADKHKPSDGPFGEVFRHTQVVVGDGGGGSGAPVPMEAIVLPPWIALAVRTRPGVWEYISSSIKLLIFNKFLVNGNFVLELDFEPFTASFPKPTLSKSIGNGVEFLNRHLSAKMFLNKESMRPLLDFLRMHPLLDFLRMHHYKGRTMMLNDRIQNINSLQSVLRIAEEYLNKLPADTPYSEFDHKFQEIGLERGWGDTTLRVHDTIQLLLDLLEAPDSCTLEKFLGRISMSVLWRTRCFNESSNKALTLSLTSLLYLVCSQMLWGPTVVSASRRSLGPNTHTFFVYPLEPRRALSEDAFPDLNDGNIVASLLAHKLGVTQCTIAHALEKTKYPNSNIYWKSFEEKYHFSCQFTADLIAMNHTDFIITSTFQEIVGKTLLDNTSRPQLSLSPIYTELFMELTFLTLNSTLFLLKLISDQSIYFPYTDEKNRLTTLHPEIEDLL
ncbi:Sucrose synthase [Bienertia sinuspersici]